MTDVLKWEQYIQDACDEMVDGDTVRINHTTCPAGADTRQRLYLTKPHHGGDRVLGYCHNCQNGGAFKVEEGYRPVFGASPHYTPPDIEHTVLDIDSFVRFEDAPHDVRHHAFQYGLTEWTCSRGMLSYDPATHRLVFPIYKNMWYDGVGWQYGVVQGFQLKKIHNNNDVKYITKMNSQEADMSTVMGYYDTDGPKHPTQFIVEDYLSGLRLLQYAMVSREDVEVLVNYGTKVNPLAIKRFLGGGARCIVWLDNDNDHVRMQAQSISQVCRLISPITKVHVEARHADPKYCSYTEIDEVTGWTT